MVTSRGGGSGCRAAQNSCKVLTAPADHLVASGERSLGTGGCVQDLPGRSDLRELVMPGDCFQGGGPAATQQAGVPGEPVLGQGGPAASQDRRDGLSCLRGSEMGWRPGPQPGRWDTGRSATATALTGLLACLDQLRDRRRGRAAAAVVLSGLLAPDVASGRGFQPVKGSGPG